MAWYVGLFIRLMGAIFAVVTRDATIVLKSHRRSFYGSNYAL